jgi:hypothetical protein
MNLVAREGLTWGSPALLTWRRVGCRGEAPPRQSSMNFGIKLYHVIIVWKFQ